MSILLQDAKRSLGGTAAAPEELVYADDTLLIGMCGRHVEEFMASIEACIVGE